MIEWIITSSLLILVVVLLRRVLRGRMSLRLQYGLWGLVLIRLLLPFSFFESDLSVMNLAGRLKGVELMETVGEIQGMDEIEFCPIEPTISTTATDIMPIAPSTVGSISAYYSGDSDHTFPTQVMDNATVEEFQQLEKAVKARDILIPIWLIGAAIMAANFLFTNLRFGGALCRSRREKDIPGSIIPVYVSEIIPTPCLFGLFRPAVYITPDCEKDLGTLRHVLAHESTHYRHGDNIWAVLRCVTLSVHWYNPLVWWAAVLSKRDAELACDEGAIRHLGESERAPYGRTLIGMTCQRSDIGALAHTSTTMTGSKAGIKERIMLIAKKPKMAVYTLVAVILIGATAALCTFSGASSGFTDNEARKEALGHAEAVAFENGLELDGRSEILRYEGGPTEADPETNVQYVQVSYPLKNSLQRIVVEFCMTDGKGQHYDEPFSVTSWLSLSNTQIVPVPADRIERVQIWKNGYPNSAVPGAYFEEIKEYMPYFFYGEEYPTGILMGEKVNSTGFTVYLKDGSSVTFGLDYMEQNGVYYTVSSPELPDWLTEILTAPGKLEIEYDELIRVNDVVKAKVDPDIIELAVDYVRHEVEYYVRDCGVNIIAAELSALESIATGAADQQGNAIEMYRLEYRLLPKDPDSVMLAGGMRMDGEWITEWGSAGQPYMMVYMENGAYTGLSRDVSTDFLDMEYSTEAMLERFGNKYTAAAMMFLYQIISDYEHSYYVMLSSGGVGLPPYYHLRYEQLWTENGWLSADGKPLNFDEIAIPSFTIGDYPGALVGYTELAISFDRFIGRSEMTILNENFEPINFGNQIFYEAEDLYALDPGSYYVTFDITVPREYVPDEGEFAHSVYTCIFRLEVTPNEEGAFYFTGDAESLMELYAREVHAKEMLAVEGDYAITDYKLVSCDVYAERVDGAVIIGEMHYAIRPVNWNFPDWWAGSGMEEGEGEYEGMWIRHNQFTLESRGDGFWKCTDMGTGGAGGWGFIRNQTPEATLSDALNVLKEPDLDKTYLLWSLPLINFLDMDADDFFELMDAVDEVCVGEGIVYGPEEWRTWADVYPDDQFYRNMYCMKAALNTDGAYGARMQYILNKQMHHDEELFARCLQYFSLEEQDILISLADDDLV